MCVCVCVCLYATPRHPIYGILYFHTLHLNEKNETAFACSAFYNDILLHLLVRFDCACVGSHFPLRYTLKCLPLVRRHIWLTDSMWTGIEITPSLYQSSLKKESNAIGFLIIRDSIMKERERERGSKLNQQNIINDVIIIIIKHHRQRASRAMLRLVFRVYNGAQTKKKYGEKYKIIIIIYE